MNFLRLFLLSIPLFSLGRYLGGKFISLSVVLSLVIALYAVVMLAGNRLKKSDFAWSAPFFWFIGVAIIGLMLSPYGMAPLNKGAVQLVGLLMMILVTAYILRYVKNNPQRLVLLLRFFLALLGVYSAIGIVQCLLGTLTPFQLSFDFLNTLAGAGGGGGGTVWRDPGVMGPIKRTNSLAAEPTLFATYLCVGLGVALIRLGVLGPRYQAVSVSLLSKWTAYSIIVGMLLTFSINGWLMFLVVVGALFFVSSKISPGMLLKVAAGMVSLLLVLYIAALFAGQQFFDKFSTLALITLDADVGDMATQKISALAMASNLEVTYQNFTNHPILGGGLGSHPIAYEVYVPEYMSAMESEILGLNADDASSLAFRLLSETGVMGTAIFIFGLASVVYRARRAVLAHMASCPPSLYRVLAIGVSASAVGLMEAYLTRLGRYYDPIFWLAIALTLSAAYCLTREQALPFERPVGA